MAKGKHNESSTEHQDGPLEVLGCGQHWNDEFCAEHDGTISSFEGLSATLDDLCDYRIVLGTKKWNWCRGTRVVGFAVGGAVTFLPLAFLAAPGVAATLGATGILGAASTGTAISSLSGAALTSASLAAIGGGTMAAGTIVVTAVGAGLGAVNGGLVSNCYFRQVQGFDVRKIAHGKDLNVVFIDGFLTAASETTADWMAGTQGKFPNTDMYHLNWEAKALHDLGTLSVKCVNGEALRRLAIAAAKKATRKAGSKLNPVSWASALADLASNPWHVAQVKAQMTGVLLADLLARCEDQDFVLVGHSLGARVIFYMLQSASLSQRLGDRLRAVYLLGGAVGRDDESGWIRAANVVDGPIYNCFSTKDSVLNCLYRPASAYLSFPIGLGPIDGPSNIVNVDTSSIVFGHCEYKPKLDMVLAKCDHLRPYK
jgi:pimeloyl-ACP methyl ester carboxylesterase